ncbi:hypothetical protein LTR85_004490 [Meristemomyces frigidus]|nr:hypothetical protein LTR85_004490 [Meristemomyces frigidus]
MLLLLLTLLCGITARVEARSDTATHNYNLIDPFIGSVNGGNAFAGASLPFGMAKAVADVSAQDTAGWSYDFTNVTGFSALHDSGTGGNPSMGNFPFQPPVDTPRAKPGYFSLGLENGVNVEIDSHGAYRPIQLSLRDKRDCIDWDLAYEAVVNDAENEPFDWGVERCGGLQSWKRLGYIPDDFCVAAIARRLGKGAEYEKYLERSTNWLNMYRANQTSYWLNGAATGGFTGFLQPRYANGTWRYQDPVECSPLDQFCSYSSNPKETFESTKHTRKSASLHSRVRARLADLLPLPGIWEYQFYVPQNQAQLVTTLRGPERFVALLDYVHTLGLLDIGNEPSELTTYQYHYAGRPGRSAYRVHTYMPSTFNASANGLPGNDDSGASGSFLPFAMSGIFPVAEQNVYLQNPPFFERVSYTSPLTNNTATMSDVNFEPTYERIYIQNATLDG